ncbi:MAG: TonB-dependent receptor [Desulfuromonadales bacterium]|nr:TonB-dependent receptor [Desulfuromonadales bacterium]
MYRSLLGVFLCLWFCSTAYAAEADQPAAVLEEVVVTATRQEEEISTIPANVTVITESEIAQSAAQTVPELLRGVAGVLVNDIAGNGRHYTVDLRGFGETASLNTLVLVDGRRINQSDLSGVDWSLIPKDRVERIEIVRGGRGSVLYGDNATGGVINVITKKGTQEPSITGTMFAGSYDTFQGNAAVSGAMNHFSIAMNGNYRTSDGYRDNSDSLAKDLGFNLEYEVSDRLSLNLNSGYHDEETSLPGALTKSELDSGISRTATLHPDDYADTEDWYLQGGLKLFLTGDSFLNVSASTRQRESQFFSFFDVGEYIGKTEIDTLMLSPQLVLNEQLFGYVTKVLLGFDYEKSDEDILNESIFFGFPSVASYELSKESYGYFAHADISLTEDLAVSGGFRKDRAEFEFKSIDAGMSDSNTISEDLYTLGGNYRFMDNSSVYVSYSKSFRYPVLDEMFNFFANSVNSNLKSQTSDDYEVGLRHTFESGLALSVNLFRVVTENEIFFNPTTFANENLDGESVRQGIELSASKEIYDILFNGSYTLRDTEIDGGQYDGKELPNVPKHQLTLGASKQFGRHILLGLNGTYVGERRFISDFDNSHDKLDDYFYLTGKLSYLLKKGSAFIAINNILDEEYSEFGALNFMGEGGFYPSPEINFVAGLSFVF